MIEKIIAFIAALMMLLMPVEEEAWEPEPKDIAYVSRVIWGETRGCPYDEQWAQGCCVVNRVDDSRWPNTVEAVVVQPNQFQGYSIKNPVEPFYDMAREILIAWHNGDTGVPKDMVFCSGNGKHQTFRNTYEITSETVFYP